MRTDEPTQPASPSFRQLFAEHEERVREVARRSGVSDGDIDDVVQVTLVFLWRRLGRAEPLTSVEGWLSTVARRVSWVHNRAALRARHFPGGYLPEEGELFTPSDAEILEAKSELDFVLALMQKLPPEQREIFLRHELRGEPIPQIAKSLGIPMGTGYTRLLLARKAFGRALHRARLRDHGLVFFPFLALGEGAAQKAPSRSAHRLLSEWGLRALIALLPLILVAPKPAEIALVAVPASVAASAAAPAEEGVQSPPPPAGSSVAPAQRPAAPAQRPAASAEQRPAAPAQRPAAPAQRPAAPAQRPAASAEQRPAASAEQRPPAFPQRSATAFARRRAQEVGRILLDRARRQSMAGDSDAQRRTLSEYARRAPGDPLPAVRMASGK